LPAPPPSSLHNAFATQLFVHHCTAAHTMLFEPLREIDCKFEMLF